MKRWISFTLSLVLALTVLTGCTGGSEGKSEPNSSGANTAGTEGSKEGSAVKDTLIWAQGADVTSLDPHVGKETAAVGVTCNIFDTLLTVDANNQPQPSIAESWEKVDDLTWTFKIRQDVTFHDGSKLTAEDVKFSLDRAIASPYVSYIVDFIASVTVDDEYSITIVTKNPYAPILSNLAVPFSAIIPKAAVEADEKGFQLNPIGSGPYKFVEWKQGEYVKLTANPDYFNGAPKTQNLQMRVILEGAQRNIALETGEIDIAYDIAPNDISKVRENESLQLYEGPSLSTYYLGLNMKKEAFANEKVRQAISYAIDRQAIIEGIAYGAGESAPSLIPTVAFGFSDKAKYYEYDLEKAKALMKEAGYENGFNARLLVNDNQTRVEVCQVLQSQLKEIGINIEIDVMEFGSFIEATSAGQHDMAYFAWTCSTSDADYTYYSLLHSSQQGAPGNRSFVDDAKVDELVEKGRSTIDPEERKAIYDELEEYLGEYIPYVNIYYSNINAGANKKVKDFVIAPTGYHRYAKVYAEK